MSGIGLLLSLLMASSMALSDSSYKALQDEARSSSFTPTSTKGHSIPRPLGAQPMLYAQNRDSYSNAAVQPQYSVPAATQGGTAAAASSSYGAPATGGSLGGGYGQGPGQQSMTYYYYHYPAQQQSGGYGDTSGSELI